MVSIESLIYGGLIGLVFGIIVGIAWKYKLKKAYEACEGSHEKILTVYEEWEEVGIKLKIQMTEFTNELLNTNEWLNIAYHTWVSERLYEASQDPSAQMEPYWFGETAGPKLDPKEIDMLLKS
ncbi:hypothetical protein [Candidatus Borrarchaeum sp.]|uniref:hypothetical protein n=1 Tax=Candidatus Borrarchaeum sp. TaxID=2846742 RepID=UPI00257D21D7|nr:hypothetical protein [Candidatus Borrarchaeum sp.]